MQDSVRASMPCPQKRKRSTGPTRPWASFNSHQKSVGVIASRQDMYRGEIVFQVSSPRLFAWLRRCSKLRITVVIAVRVVLQCCSACSARAAHAPSSRPPLDARMPYVQRTAVVEDRHLYQCSSSLYDVPGVYEHTLFTTKYDFIRGKKQERWSRLDFFYLNRIIVGTFCTTWSLWYNESRFSYFPINLSLAFLVLVFLVCMIGVLY